MKSYTGNVNDIFEAFVLTEATTKNLYSFLKYRPESRLRNQIQAGFTVIYNEKISGVTRWVDGKSWSPSRFKDGFFIYREMSSKKDGKPRNFTGLKKKVISILAPNGDHLHLANYYDDTKLPGVIESISGHLEAADILKEADKYCYFKCFRTRSQSWRQPCSAPQSNSSSSLRRNSSVFSISSSNSLFSCGDGKFQLPKISPLSKNTYSGSLQTEDERQLKLMFRFAFL